MNDYAIILGISSGMGKATAKELISKGINIYGIDIRKSTELLDELESIGKTTKASVHFKKMSATNQEKRDEVIQHLLSFGNNTRIKILLHSLAFGALKPFISSDNNEILTKQE